VRAKEKPSKKKKKKTEKTTENSTKKFKICCPQRNATTKTQNAERVK
jgi:hypothetical protein